MPIEPSSPWIAVADRLPPDSQYVLIFRRRILPPRVAYFDVDLGWVINGVRAQVQPTYWMPIPPLPETA